MGKQLLIVCMFACVSSGISFGQQQDYTEKVTTLDGTISTLYQVISGGKGEVRDWDLFRFLFYENAKLIPTGKDKANVHKGRFMTPEDYINSSGAWLVANGFFENELHRVVETYGNIAHVFSSYESFRTQEETEPFMRGINSIQLLFDGNRWWIINIYWQSESPEHPIPQRYLPKN